MRIPSDKIFSLEETLRHIQVLKKNGKTVVTTNGCFDLLHRGHLAYLAEARALGDALFIGVNSDASVKKLKGPQRPIVSEQDRLYALAALECVDGVFSFDGTTPAAWLDKLRPQIHVKGADYEGKEIPEKAAMEKFGGTLRFIKFLPGYSTSNLIQRIHQTS